MGSKVRKITNLVLSYLFILLFIVGFLVDNPSASSLLTAVASKHAGVLRSQLKALEHTALVLHEAKNMVKNNPEKQPFCGIYENAFLCIILLEF